MSLSQLCQEGRDIEGRTGAMGENMAALSHMHAFTRSLANVCSTAKSLLYVQGKPIQTMMA